jgi:hypothetical protein
MAPTAAGKKWTSEIKVRFMPVSLEKPRPVVNRRRHEQYRIGMEIWKHALNTGG